LEIRVLTRRYRYELLFHHYHDVHIPFRSINFLLKVESSRLQVPFLFRRQRAIVLAGNHAHERRGIPLVLVRTRQCHSECKIYLITHWPTKQRKFIWFQQMLIFSRCGNLLASRAGCNTNCTCQNFGTEHKKHTIKCGFCKIAAQLFIPVALSIIKIIFEMK
jgi:hypothetical protein